MMKESSCRRWVCLQFAVIMCLLLLQSCYEKGRLDKATVVKIWMVLVSTAFVLSILIYRSARCPNCGKNLFNADSPWRGGLLLPLLIGGRPVCEKCKKKDS